MKFKDKAENFNRQEKESRRKGKFVMRYKDFCILVNVMFG